MSADLSNSLILDGYRLIRFLGRGGFGEVWLCQSQSMGDYRALKFIPIHHGDRLEKEYDALLHYRRAAAQLRSPHLVTIEHVNRNDAGLYYVMPLADGGGADDPSDPAWVPQSLSTMIHDRAEGPEWFSSREISAILLPVLQGLQTLSEAGLVHRDVKPENILFFNGHPCLGDISLLGADASVITRRGTPGYATPSWYMGGHPDMYGVAATLYPLLTGNTPDKMGRSAFNWPPQGEASLPESERTEWKRLHGVIHRATDEKVSERFVDFNAMASAISIPIDNQPPQKARRSRLTIPILTGTGIAAAILLAAFYPKYKAGDAAEKINSATETSVTDVNATPITTPAITMFADASPLGSASRRFNEAHLVYSAIAAIQPSDPDDPDFMSGDENNLHQTTLQDFQNCIWDINHLDIQTAVRVFDTFLNAVPRQKRRANTRLASLLLKQCVDNRTPPLTELDDPSFLVLGNDDLFYRVALLCHLDAEKIAEKFLGDFITKECRSPRKKSEAFIARARVRAKLGSFPDARSDADQSIALIADNLALKTQRQSDIIKLEREFPAYAAYLKTLPGK